VVRPIVSPTRGYTTEVGARERERRGSTASGSPLHFAPGNLALRNIAELERGPNDDERIVLCRTKQYGVEHGVS